MPLKLIQGKQINVSLTGSFTGSFSGSFNGTGSYATQALSASFASTASFAPNYQLTSGTGSMLAPYILASQTSSMTVLSASFALTASFAPNYQLTSGTGSFATTSSFNSFTSSYNTGSFTGSFSGSLFGTASFATQALTASFAPNYVLNSSTGSFVTNNQTSSFVQNIQTSSMLAPYVLTSQTSSMTVLSSSYALTASFALNAGTTINTGSFVTTSSFSSFTSSYNTGSFTGSFSGSLFGTASFATTASYVTPLSQTVIITGSLRGNVIISLITSATASLNLATSNFFTLTLANGANTHISASNIQPGQTVNIRVTQGSAGTGTLSFNSAIKQSSGSLYTGSMITNAVDIVSLIAFDSTNAYISYINNFV